MATAAGAAVTKLHDGVQSSWSPDGRCLALSEAGGGEPGGLNPYADVVVVRYGIRSSQRGHEVARIFSDAKMNFGPSWAPDARQLVFSSAEADESWLLTSPIGGGSPEELTPFVDWTQSPVSFHDDEAPVWSPDGNTIAFSRRTVRYTASDKTVFGVSHLYVIRPDGKGLRLVPRTAGAHNPSWSPDARRLAFDSSGRIAVVNVQSGVRRDLTTPKAQRDSDPAWAPNGQTIAFVRSGDIWTMSATGTKQRLFVQKGTQPAWRPR